MDKSKLSNEELINLNHPDEGDEPAVLQTTETVTPPVVTAPVVSAVVEEVVTPPVIVAATTEKTDPLETTDDAAIVEAPVVAESPRDRSIVRAARASERRAHARLAEANAEMERLRKLVPAANTALPEVDEKTRKDLESYAPTAAARLAAVEAENARLLELAKASKPTPAPAPEFEAESFDEPIQADIDEVEELYDWQNKPEHADNWARAKTIDKFLSTHPEWKDKPRVERFAEVVAMRKLELAKLASPTPPQPKPKPTAEDAKRVIEEKAKVAPVSTGDLRGRAPPTQITSKREAWKTMSNEQLLASMPEE